MLVLGPKAVACGEKGELADWEAAPDAPSDELPEALVDMLEIMRNPERTRMLSSCVTTWQMPSAMQAAKSVQETCAQLEGERRDDRQMSWETETVESRARQWWAARTSLSLVRVVKTGRTDDDQTRRRR